MILIATLFLNGIMINTKETYNIIPKSNNKTTLISPKILYAFGCREGK